MEPLVIFGTALAIALAMRMAADVWDRERLRNYFHEQGSRVTNITWSPFGPGWFGEKGDRIYEVSFVDREGFSRSVFCKTSMWTGVYFQQESAGLFSSGYGRRSPRVSSDDSLAAENQRLREQIAQMHRDRGGS